MLDFHAKGARPLRYCTANPAHAEDAESLTGGVMAECEVRTAPITLADSREGDSDAPEGTEEEKDGDVCSGFVDCYGG